MKLKKYDCVKNLKETDDADNKTEYVLHKLHSDLLRSEGSLHPVST